MSRTLTNIIALLWKEYERESVVMMFAHTPKFQLLLFCTTFVFRSVSYLVSQLVGQLVGWLVSQLVSQLVGQLVSQLVSQLSASLVGQLVGWLACFVITITYSSVILLLSPALTINQPSPPPYNSLLSHLLTLSPLLSSHPFSHPFLSSLTSQHFCA